MNRIFKVLWNAATGTFVVTSETAKSRGKKNGRRKLAVSALIGLSSIMVSADALANAGNDTGDGVTPTGTQTGGKGWIAIGTDATANTYTNVDGASAAMGYKASAMGKWSTAIGSYSQSTGDSSLALGVKSVSAGDRAIAMGASSSASGSYSMAMGVYANSSGAKSVALGYKSVASGATSSALGYQATASGDDSAAFGNGAKAVGTNSVALGSGSIAQEDNSVAVGNSTTQRQITYVAKGDINSTSTDAVTGAQIYSLSQSVADRLGGGASVNSDGTVNAPLYEVGTGIYNNVGSALSALNTSITNTEASVAGLAEDALLWDDSTSAFSASHTGNASKITNLAAGTLAADSTDAVNGSQLFDTNEKVDQNTADITANTDSINQNTADITANTDSINQNTTDIAANTTSINQNTTDIATNTTNINSLSDSVTTLTDDALLWDAASGAFSAKHNGNDSKITNLAAGSADTDAVNVSQLKVTDAQVSRNTQSITNLNTQVSNLDTRVTNIENGIGDIVTTGSTKYFKTNTDGADANAQGADSVAIGSGSIAAAENSVALGTNSVADEANTVSVGSSTQQRRITNVAAGVNNTDAVNVAQLKASEAGSVRYETNADGSVNYSVLNLGDGSGGTTRIGNVSAAVNDTDAVNYAQLKRSVEEANTYTDQKMGEMNSKIKGVENKMSGGIASAMAMAGLPQAYAPGANMTSIAGGTFNGESAVAIGVSMVSESGGWVYKLQGTSNSQGDYSAAIGAGFQW